MDEKQLKDLLDEAYSYKKFSDRDSKSKIFKVKQVIWFSLII